MDYDERDVNTHLYLFDLPYADKELLAKFEGFSNVEKWEKDKREKLTWLTDPKKNINYNIFHKISRCDNHEEIGKFVPIEHWNDIFNDIIQKIANGDTENYNPIQFDTMVTLWVLKNKPEHFNL